MNQHNRPGAEPAHTSRTPRVVAARRLLRRKDRDQHGRFLAEGQQAVREAVAAGAVVELFVTSGARTRHTDLVEAATQAGARISTVTDEALTSLAETMNPQGILAVCRQRDVPLAEALSRGPRLVAVLVANRDPGNAGTVLRTADAAGATVVVFAGDTVDPYNGKCVRASAGSLFHVDVVRAASAQAAVEALRSAGLLVLATQPRGETDLDGLICDGSLAAGTAWLFGSEAHGLPADLAATADRRVSIPIHGRAESLNLAAAAAVCLYASAHAQRAQPAPETPANRPGFRVTKADVPHASTSSVGKT